MLTNVLEAVVILLAGTVVVWAISRIVDAALHRVGFDEVVTRGVVKQALAHTRHQASDLVAAVLFGGLFLLVLQATFDAFGDNAASDGIAMVIESIPRLLLAVAIVATTIALAAAANVALQRFLGSVPGAAALATVARAAVIAVGVFAALRHLELASPIVDGLFDGSLAVVAAACIIAIAVGALRPLLDSTARR